MVVTLLIKALRDIWRHKGAYVACAAIMGLGVAVFSSMSQMTSGIENATHTFYRNQRLADGFARMVGMSRGDLAGLERVKGVDRVQGRLTTLANIVTDDRRNASLRLHSFDEADEGRLNDILLLSGELPSGREPTLCIGETYFSANGMTLGDSITVAVRGRKIDMRVTGLMQSPEYTYVTPEGVSFLPDDSGYGVAFVPLRAMEEMLASPGGVNEVCYTLDTGVSYEQSRADVEQFLRAYGMISHGARKDQMSVKMLEEEVKGLKTMSSSLPYLFLVIGCMMTTVIVKRMVEQQREQIGLMKAFGYGSVSIIGHYAGYGVVIGALSAGIGGSMGSLLAGSFASMYKDFFHLPGITGAFSAEDFVQLAAISLVFAVFASVYGARGVLKLPAAEALRPPAPPSGKPILLERIPFLWRGLRAATQLTLRNMMRNRTRSLTTLGSMAVCFALVACVFSFYPIFVFLLDRELRDVQHFDLRVQMRDITDAKALGRSLLHFSGVSSVETLLELPATIRSGEREQTLTVLGIDKGASMYRLFDTNDRAMDLPDAGVVVNAYTAKLLSVSVGDTLTLSFSYPDKTIRLNIAAIASQYLGANVFVDRTLLCGALDSGDIATSATLMTQGKQAEIDRLLERLGDAENVASVTNAEQAYRSMSSQFDMYMGIFYVMGVVSSLVGFAVLYNASIVSLSERARELMSMRVLGFTRGETAGVINFEQIILAVIGTALGIPLAKQLFVLLASSMASDSYTLPTLITSEAYAQALICVAAAVFLSSLMVARRISRLSMVEVLKERE